MVKVASAYSGLKLYVGSRLNTIDSSRYTKIVVIQCSYTHLFTITCVVVAKMNCVVLQLNSKNSHGMEQKKGGQCGQNVVQKTNTLGF